MGLGEKFEAAKDQIVGDAKEKFGDATDDGSMQAEGAAQSAKGDLREGWENAKDDMGDALDDAKNWLAHDGLWFQAVEACGNSQKRLPSNAEWQKAVPNALTPRGWKRLKRYLHRRYNIDGRWIRRATLPLEVSRPWPRKGVNVVAHHDYPSGLGVVSAELVDAIQKAGFTTALFQDGAAATTLMSGTFYQWLQLDRHQFAQTYAGPDPAAALATAERLLIEAAVKATPRAKGRSTGAYTLPDLVVIVTADEPIPTVSCFEDAVGGDHVPQDAAARLAAALQFSDTLIGYRGVRVLWGLPGEQPQFPTGRS